MTKRIFAAVLLLCLFVSVVYAQSAATVFGWPPADGSVTNAKLAEPVSVANGGTGKTTAAEGLAALGGASLNGSSTVPFNASIYKTATGTAAAPAYTFSSDPDTGIYSPGANTLGFGVGGEQLLSLSKTHRNYGAAVNIASSTFGGGGVCSSLADVVAGKGAAAVSLANPVVDVALLYDSTDKPAMQAFNYSIETALPLLFNPYGGNVLIATSTDDGANKLQVNGFTKLGEAATGIKMKVLTGTTAAAEDSYLQIAHGLTQSKIVSVSAIVLGDSGATGFTPGWGAGAPSAEHEFYLYTDGTNATIYLSATNSGGLVSSPAAITIWYKE